MSSGVKQSVVCKVGGKVVVDISSDTLQAVNATPESNKKDYDKFSFEFQGKHDHGDLQPVKDGSKCLTEMSQFIKQAKDILNVELEKLSKN